jgi:phosphoglycerate dehydrogenase-like enzyme
MKMHVHILSDNDDSWIDELQGTLDDSIELTHSTESNIPPECSVLVAGVPSREQITACKNLHSLIIPWSGLPKATRELMLDFPEISVYNLHHNATAVAEHAIALMLAAARQLIPIDRSLRRHDWTARYEPASMPLLENKTALILGYGAIGQRIARACNGLGMDVSPVRRKIDGAANQDSAVVGIESLDEVLPLANVLFVCLPLTPETEGIIGEHQLSLLPDGAIVINIARGRVIDQTALYTALKSGRIRAGLDVWYLYPQDEPSRANQPVSVHPFHELDNVVMTPHLAGHCDDIETHRIRTLSQLLSDLANDRTENHRVDVKRGY